MKQLILVRHAKSSWSDMLISDIERPLNSRGKRNAPFMAQKLKEIVKNIDTFYVSPAKRARKTAKVFLKDFSNAKWNIVEEIYEAYVSTLEDVIYSIPYEIDTAIMFGHNPGFTALTNRYAKSMIDNLPTCGIVIIDFKGENWSKFHPTSASVSDILFPKQFGE